MSEKIEALIEQIGSLTMQEAADMGKLMEEKWGIQASNLQQAAPQTAAVSVEKDTATVILKSFGDKKINVLKVVKDVLGLGLMEAKNFVEDLPKTVEENLEITHAEEIKKKLEDAGGTAELK